MWLVTRYNHTAAAKQGPHCPSQLWLHSFSQKASQGVLLDACCCFCLSLQSTARLLRHTTHASMLMKAVNLAWLLAAGPSHPVAMHHAF
jgi:hypothetical protein